jgi:hypothetical protein
MCVDINTDKHVTHSKLKRSFFFWLFWHCTKNNNTMKTALFLLLATATPASAFSPPSRNIGVSSSIRNNLVGSSSSRISTTKIQAHQKLEAILFDCDGVLADTERDGHRLAFNIAFKDNGIDESWDEARYGKLLEVGGGKERMTAHWVSVYIYVQTSLLHILHMSFRCNQFNSVYSANKIHYQQLILLQTTERSRLASTNS